MSETMDNLVGKALQGDRLALSRILSEVENESPSGSAALAALYPSSGNAHRIGITGPPGSGKSTLVSQLVTAFRTRSDTASGSSKIAVIAVDPSSPFSGGALLGDRIRMRDLSGDSGVFIRSMASRGALGGLARTTAQVADVLDAVGYERILIETVGAGQAEVDIAGSAHSTVVVESPGRGDDVQAIKAGILEIADILVVNKADLEGAEQALRVLSAMIHMLPPHADPVWEVPILSTSCKQGEGIAELATCIDQHLESLKTSGGWYAHGRQQAERRLEDLMRAKLFQSFRRGIDDSVWLKMVSAVSERKLAPHIAILTLMTGEE